MGKTVLTALLVLYFLLAAGPASAGAAERLSQIKLPPGFTIRIYADGLDQPRQLALGDAGTVFAGSKRSGRIFAVTDSDGDSTGDEPIVLAVDLDQPSGVEFRAGSLYVSSLDRIVRFDDIESRLRRPPAPVLITSRLPDDNRHGRRYLRFGPDGWLYVAVGAPCNVCIEPGMGQIRRMRPDGSGQEVYVTGVRNSVGMAFQPSSGELWFTDNGRDRLGDDLPSDELNRVSSAGQNFGFPYCHQGDLSDPEFGKARPCSEFTAPVVRLGAHVAALGLLFYTGEQFPGSYRGGIFIARHGSWNRSEKVGYDLALVRFDERGVPTGVEVFASGWLQGESAWGRPADVLQMPDGSLLVSDDTADVIYRISYTGD